jgi:hypothetical protein
MRGGGEIDIYNKKYKGNIKKGKEKGREDKIRSNGKPGV